MIHWENVFDPLHTLVRAISALTSESFQTISLSIFSSHFDLVLSPTSSLRDRLREGELYWRLLMQKKMSFKTKTDGWTNKKKSIVIKTNEINTNGKKTFAQFQWNSTTKVIQRKSNNDEHKKRTNWVVNGINSSCECASIYSNRHILWPEKEIEWWKTGVFFLLLLQRIDSD